MAADLYALAKQFKETVEKEFIPRICCPRVNWPGAYESFLEQYSFQKSDISYEEFLKI